MVGTWRINTGRPFAIVWIGLPYVEGMQAVRSLSNGEFLWFDGGSELGEAHENRLKPNKAHVRPNPRE